METKVLFSYSPKQAIYNNAYKKVFGSAFKF